MLRLDPNKKLELDKQHPIDLNSTLTTPKTVNEIPTKTYIGSSLDEKEKSRRDKQLDFYNQTSYLIKYNQDKNFNDSKLTNLDSVTVNREPISNNELGNKKYGS